MGIEMPQTVITVKNLVRRFDLNKTVLDGVSFAVTQGELLTIYGKSGCGKTTLLNILGGLDRPSSGEVMVDGLSIIDMSEDELSSVRLGKIGFVFQDFNLLMDMTVEENIALPLKFSKKRDDGRVDELLKLFDIAHIAGEPANKISGGEAQRAAIARAMMNEPKIILADEPTGNLDLENTKNVMRAFEIARKDFDTTIVLATHDHDLASYATTKLLLSDGRAVLEIS